MTAVTRVLVVDDNEDSRAIYSEMLSLAGHGVVTAADGAEAIAYALRVPFDLIIVELGADLDVILQILNGIRVIKAVRSSPVARHTPIITVSAGDELMHRQALAAGANLALEKPCLPDELRDAVRTFLNGDRGGERGAARARTKRS